LANLHGFEKPWRSPNQQQHKPSAKSSSWASLFPNRIGNELGAGSNGQGMSDGNQQAGCYKSFGFRAGGQVKRLAILPEKAIKT
jgi:hypothetical protein